MILCYMFLASFGHYQVHLNTKNIKSQHNCKHKIFKVRIRSYCLWWKLPYKNKGSCKSDVWLTVHRNSVWIRKTN